MKKATQSNGNGNGKTKKPTNQELVDASLARSNAVIGAAIRRDPSIVAPEELGLFGSANLPAWLNALAEKEGWATAERSDIIQLAAARFAANVAAKPNATGSDVAEWWGQNIGVGYKVMGRILLAWGKNK